MTTLSHQLHPCRSSIHVMRIALVFLIAVVTYQVAEGRTLRSAAYPADDTLYTLYATSWTGSLCDVITPCTELSIPRRILLMNYDAEMQVFGSMTILLTVKVDSMDIIRGFQPRIVRWGREPSADSGEIAILNHVGKHLKTMVGKSRIVREPGFKRELGRSIWTPLREIYIVLGIADFIETPYCIPEKGSNAFWYQVPNEALR